jgi:rod shape-determining protein MreC
MFLLFLLLFSLGLVFTIQSHSYHKSKFINSANFLTGGVYNSINDMTSYFGLKTQNELLSEENNRLKSLLYNKGAVEGSEDEDSTFSRSYVFTSAKVIKNSYSATNNILLLNKGKRDSVKQDFGVISSKGIVGIIDKISNRFATVISILNSTNKISAQLKKTNHFGTLTWNGKTPELVQLIDIPKISPVKLGDTIMTSGRSSIFPKGILIGIVHNFKLDAAENYYELDVKLFNDMTNLEHVYIIENNNINEITNLLNNNE